MTSTTDTPLFLFDSNRHDEPGNLYPRDVGRVPWLAEFIEWARGNGIVPENTCRVEVHEGETGLFAKVTVYDLDENGRKIVLRDIEEFAKHLETVPLSSLPPLPDATP